MNNEQPRWTEIEHLPEWDEEYYDVYTAKKFGKWVMLKTLKPALKDNPEMRAMLEKEFDIRYNLAHPNIIMINDLEDVPGVGRSIITDDVYGDSLGKLLREGRFTRAHLDKMGAQLLDALDYIQANHLFHRPLSADNIIFTENIGNLKLIDVGYDQGRALPQCDTAADMAAYGRLVLDTIAASGIDDPELRRLATRCADPRRGVTNANRARIMLGKQHANRMYAYVIAFLALMVLLLVWLSLVPPAHS